MLDLLKILHITFFLRAYEILVLTDMCGKNGK